MSSPLRPRISLVLPVKELARAKSRLELPARHRRDLAYELACRSMRVATTCLPPDQVLVVTRDPSITTVAASSGAVVVPEVGFGLNAAAEQGIAEVQQRTPTHTVVVMVADLPAITPDALSSLLASVEDAQRQPVVVADRSGSGTTMVTVPADRQVPMVFGHDSAARFGALGCLAIRNAPDCLRADLDTVDDLAEIW